MGSPHQQDRSNPGRSSGLLVDNGNGSTIIPLRLVKMLIKELNRASCLHFTYSNKFFVVIIMQRITKTLISGMENHKSKEAKIITCKYSTTTILYLIFLNH